MGVARRVLQDVDVRLELGELEIEVQSADGKQLVQRLVRGRVADMLGDTSPNETIQDEADALCDITLLGQLRPLTGPIEARDTDTVDAADTHGLSIFDVPTSGGEAPIDVTIHASDDAGPDTVRAVDGLSDHTLHGSDEPPADTNRSAEGLSDYGSEDPTSHTIQGAEDAADDTIRALEAAPDHTIQDSSVLQADLIAAVAESTSLATDPAPTEDRALVPIPSTRRLVTPASDFETVDIDERAAVIDIRGVLAGVGTPEDGAPVATTIHDPDSEEDVTHNDAAGEVRRAAAEAVAAAVEAESALETVDLIHLEIRDDVPPRAPTQTGGARYALVDELGRIGGSALHFAYDVAAEPTLLPCVLRRLLPVQAPGAAARRRRFLTEGRIGCSLRHPHIVSVFDYGEHAGAPVLVREIVDGINLHALSSLSDGPLSVPVVASIGWQIAQGLAYGHSRRDRSGRWLQLVHGELGPTTVKISRSGNVKISEFGVSRLDDQPVLTTDGGRAGFDGYAAPEQTAGAAIDGRTDLYALGVLLTELLSDDPIPKSADDPSREVGLRCAARADVPPALSRLLCRMTERLPEDRPADADEVISGLEAVLDTLAAWPRLDELLCPVFAVAAGGQLPGESLLPSAPAPVPLTQVPDLEVSVGPPARLEARLPPDLLHLPSSNEAPAAGLPLTAPRRESTTANRVSRVSRTPPPPRGLVGTSARFGAAAPRRRRAPRFPLRGMRPSRPPRMAMGSAEWVAASESDLAPPPTAEVTERAPPSIAPESPDGELRLRRSAYAIIAMGLIIIAFALYELLK